MASSGLPGAPSTSCTSVRPRSRSARATAAALTRCPVAAASAAPSGRARASAPRALECASLAAGQTHCHSHCHFHFHIHSCSGSGASARGVGESAAGRHWNRECPRAPALPVSGAARAQLCAASASSAHCSAGNGAPERATAQAEHPGARGRAAPTARVGAARRGGRGGAVHGAGGRTPRAPAARVGLERLRVLRRLPQLHLRLLCARVRRARPRRPLYVLLSHAILLLYSNPYFVQIILVQCTDINTVLAYTGIAHYSCNII